MKIFTEKGAEFFLEKNGFDVLEGIFITEKKKLQKAIEKLDFPLVAKISGEKIIHKKNLGGVIASIENYSDLISAFNKLKKIKDCEEVLIQRRVEGIELFFGIKKTPEFSHVLVFGKGGSDIEKVKDVSFRVCPIKNFDAIEMINETKIALKLTNKEKDFARNILIKLCGLVKKFPDIVELDINPMIQGKIVDSRIIFS